MKNITKLFCILILFYSNIVYADITFWTTEVQPARMAKQEEMAKSFEAKTGIKVEVIPIEEKDLGTRATAAAASGNLPDVIYHTLQYVLPWAEAGILDVDANNDVVKALGKKTFAPGALKMAKSGSKIAAVPVDGWTQMVVYRKDLFESAGLEPPTNYANITKAIKALSGNDMFGFVAATKTDENFMSQVLEHVFLANGVSPVNKNGFSPLDEKATSEVLNFYKKIAKASPAGELYWKQSRAIYFAGKAAMIIWSPFILDELAGLRNSAPPTINDDPTSKALAQKTGIVTTFGVLLGDSSVGAPRNFCYASQLICCTNIVSIVYSMTHNVDLSKASMLTGPLDMYVTWLSFAYFGGSAVFSTSAIGVFNVIQCVMQGMMTIQMTVGLLAMAKDPKGYKKYYGNSTFKI